ncbi:unnamed protein product [Nyctereutes procyonoides]|uniref:(raccoon dog) hypothetical protein n=1 Tax=Nyctereutes procyonoides TaxID=34880 RepID=A0A811Z2T5_NYCPR|nr:GRB2-associated-binding protein 3 [Nyctereutes procyonoides]CAD7682970.1 unnamed protein product [Nyctereutes procyonoides]
MSAGDAVCTGWLVKSPPERKLQRYAWRKRWFVLRRGRMSGNPDVLEYYRNKHSSKPIRVIDLSECAVWKHVGPGFVRKEFQNNFVFIVKTTSRTFYLVAKTEVEMLVWVYSISQVCNLGHLEDGAAAPAERWPGPPASLQPPAGPPPGPPPAARALGASLPRAELRGAADDSRSEADFLSLPDYLVLSHCESGRPRHASLPSRCDSWPHAERPPEPTSCDDVFVACAQPGAQHAPPPRSSPRPDSSARAPREPDPAPRTPPPRPPKPSHLSERRQDAQPEGAAASRRVSLSGLDNVRTRKADVEGQSLRHRDKRLSLNLPRRLSPVRPPACAGPGDGYVPMGPQAGARVAGAPCSRDDYMAMSPGSLCGPLPELPADLEPPPVNRDLKPQRRPRPPPLDLRNLSTIREHASLSRTCTVPCNRTRFLSPERNGINSARFFADSVSREEEESYIQMNHGTANPLGSGALTWTKKFSLDYLALDFNSASPAPVQQKLLLAEEQRVDYVQVDEQKTQALQSTKQEWTDERQSKV